MTPNGFLAIEKNNESRSYYLMLPCSRGAALVHCPVKHGCYYDSPDALIEYAKTAEVKSLHRMIIYLMNNYYLLSQHNTPSGWRLSIYLTA